MGCGFAQVGEAGFESGDDGGRGFEEGDEARGGDGSGAHGADVCGPEVAGGHLRDGPGAGVERAGEVGAEEVDGGHEHEPGEDAAGEDGSGDAGADDVADAEVFRSDVGADGGAFHDVLCAEIGFVIGGGGPCGEKVGVLKESVKGAEAEGDEDTACEGAAVLAGEENVGAGGAFRVSEVAVFFDDELAAEGNHEKDAQPAAEQGEDEDAGVLEAEAEEDERGECEDDARGDGLPGVSGGLDDVVFKDGCAAQSAEDADG